MNSNSGATELAQLFMALADPTRLRLLNLMNGREVCVCEFVSILEVPQPKISRHLAYMRRAKIVVARREGKWMFYSILKPKDPAAACILDCALGTLSERKEMKADIRCLGQNCCES
jgi:ArsR family transcriptional regulator, arsenate/arsenite/antimonite-responsive transcriptional repressor